MCGKDGVKLKRRRLRLGSPPRVRERQSSSSTPKKLVRITPACAGKTGFTKKNKERIQDHPRVCGKDTLSG